MSFSIKITPRNDPTGTTAYAVTVIIDDHETVVSFEFREDAESFAQTERARLTDDAQKARSAPPTGTPRAVMIDGIATREIGPTGFCGRDLRPSV